MLSRRQLLAAPAMAAAKPSVYRHRAELPTPALVLDLDAFEANVSKMASHLKTRGRGFRPHGKTHKCPEIARRLIAAGALGACAAKIGEAEAFSAAGIGGLLITGAAVGRAKIQRLVQLAWKRRETIVCVDNARNAEELNEAARQARLRLDVAIDLWVGRRTGIPTGAPAIALAEAIDSMKHLRFAGLQAYAGHAAHVKGFENRAKSSQEAMAGAVETRRALEKKGMRCDWISGGSTGTYNIDTEIDGVTELQPGSFIFMDMDYRAIGGRGGAVYEDFRPSLFVACTVISRPQPRLAIVDGGFKAFATDRGYGPEAWQRPDLKYRFAGDEHGAVEMSGDELKVGDRVEFLAPHCDPTVNLFDCIYAVRGDKVEAAWEITARGKSQ